VDEGAAGLDKAMEKLCAQASNAIKEGVNILILSDRGINAAQAAIPALLAVAGLHHHLIREGTRTRVGLVLESGEPREVHHFSLLIGYGAGAINPYLAFETLDDMIRQGLLKDINTRKPARTTSRPRSKASSRSPPRWVSRRFRAIEARKFLRPSDSTIRLLINTSPGTASRVEGVGMDVVAREVEMRHRLAFPNRPVNGHTLPAGGQYQWRQDGEYHLFNPQTVHKLQLACRKGNYKAFKEYSSLVNDQTRQWCTLRGLLDFKSSTPIPIEEVEPAEDIVKRFKTGAMSYGSISKEAHETLAVAMNRLGGKSNTGEGGEDPARYVPDANGDSRNSAIKQVASGRFGVTSLYLTQARELQIKMAQGAKPGEGGQLPGNKVYPWIAKVRLSTPGVGLISPPPHHDIYSIEDLAELIHDLKNANHHARISVKLVAEVGVGTIAAGVAKAHADVVLISGFDGGTGASPQTSIKHAGIPWELGLAETHQTLVLKQFAQPNRRRDRRTTQDWARCHHRRFAGRGRIWVFHRSAGFARLHHDASVPSQYLSGRRGHPKPAASQTVHRRAGARRQLYAIYRRGSPGTAGPTGLPQPERPDRPDRFCSKQRRPLNTGKRAGWISARSFISPKSARRWGAFVRWPRTMGWIKPSIIRCCSSSANRPSSGASRSAPLCPFGTSTGLSARLSAAN